MRISELLKQIKAQVIFGRTPWGRKIHEKAIQTIEACVIDEKNHGSDAVQCLNCGIIISELLVPDGCVYCRCPDMTVNIRMK